VGRGETLDWAVHLAKKLSKKSGQDRFRVLDGAAHRVEVIQGKARWLVPCLACRGSGRNDTYSWRCPNCYGTLVEIDMSWRGVVA
jgi:hypothetical protein